MEENSNINNNNQVEDQLIGPNEIEKLNSFSDILIKLLNEIDSRTRDIPSSSRPHTSLQDGLLTQRTPRLLTDYITNGEHLKSIENLEHTIDEHKRKLSKILLDNEEIITTLKNIKSSEPPITQKEFTAFQHSLQLDFEMRIERAIADVIPPDTEFPQITMDTSSEELLRILVGRLQNLEIKVHHQNQVIDLFKRNFEDEKNKNELLMADFKTKFDGHEFNFQTQHTWNRKTTESFELLTDLLKKHQKDYKAYTTNQATNNTKRDETIYAIQNHIKKLEKHYKQLTEEFNQKTFNISPLAILNTNGSNFLSTNTPSLLSPNHNNNTNNNNNINNSVNSNNVTLDSVPNLIIPQLPQLSQNEKKQNLQQPIYKDELIQDSLFDNYSSNPNEVGNGSNLSIITNNNVNNPSSTSATSTSISTSKPKKNSKVKSKKTSTSSKSTSESYPSIDQQSSTEILSSRKNSIKLTLSADSDEDINGIHHNEDYASYPNHHENELINQDYERRIINTESEIVKINSTMEVVLQGFKQLGDLLMKQTAAKIKKKTMIIQNNNNNNPNNNSNNNTTTTNISNNINPTINMPLSINMHHITQNILSQSNHPNDPTNNNHNSNTSENNLIQQNSNSPNENNNNNNNNNSDNNEKIIDSSNNQTPSEELQSNEVKIQSHSVISPDSNELNSNQHLNHEQHIIIEDNNQDNNQINNNVIREYEKITPINIQQDHRVTKIDNHIIKTYESLPSKQILHQTTSQMEHDPILIEVEEEVHQIIGALVKIGNLGIDILNHDVDSSYEPTLFSHHSQHPENSTNQTTNSSISNSSTSTSGLSSSNKNHGKKSRHMSIRGSNSQTNGPHLDQTTINKVIHDIDEKQEEKYHQLESKLKTLDDNYRQLKLQFVTIQDNLKSLKTTVNNGIGTNNNNNNNNNNTSPNKNSDNKSNNSNNNNNNNNNNKKSYKNQIIKDKGDKHEGGENQDWLPSYEELKTIIYQLKNQVDQLLDTKKQLLNGNNNSDDVKSKIYPQSLYHSDLNSLASNDIQSLSTKIPHYHDDDNNSNMSMGDLSIMTESLHDGNQHHQHQLHHHQQQQQSRKNSSNMIPITKTVYQVESNSHLEGVSSPNLSNNMSHHDTDMTDDISEINYDPNLPSLATMLPIEQRIIKLEKMILENEIIPDKLMYKSNVGSDILPDYELIDKLTEEVETIKLIENDHTKKIEQIQSDMIQSNEILNKLKYITDSLNVMSDEINSTLPREELDRILMNINSEIKGIKKATVEKDWIQNKLHQKVDKSEMDKLVSGITSIIGDPFSNTVAATHKCLVCDKPVSLALDGKPSNGYDKADDPNLPHSPIKRPGTVSGRLTSNNYQLAHSNSNPSSLQSSQMTTDINIVRTSIESLPLPPVVLPGSDKNKITVKKPQNQIQRRIRSAAGGGLGGSYQIDTR